MTKSTVLVESFQAHFLLQVDFLFQLNGRERCEISAKTAQSLLKTTEEKKKKNYYPFYEQLTYLLPHEERTFLWEQQS